MYVTDQLPPGRHSVEILNLPVANSCPSGHENVTTVPKAVSRLDAKAPSPGFNIGQSVRANKRLSHTRRFAAFRILTGGKVGLPAVAAVQSVGHEPDEHLPALGGESDLWLDVPSETVRGMQAEAVCVRAVVYLAISRESS